VEAPVLHIVPIRQHSPVKDAHYQDTRALFSIKQDVSAMFMAAQTGAHGVTGSANSRIPGEHLATIF
jgi:hypothetical protein